MGRDASGMYIEAIIAPYPEYGLWRCVTAFPMSPSTQKAYLRRTKNEKAVTVDAFKEVPDEPIEFPEGEITDDEKKEILRKRIISEAETEKEASGVHSGTS
jgi:hypothetical protein